MSRGQFLKKFAEISNKISHTSSYIQGEPQTMRPTTRNNDQKIWEKYTFFRCFKMRSKWPPSFSKQVLTRRCRFRSMFINIFWGIPLMRLMTASFNYDSVWFLRENIVLDVSPQEIIQGNISGDLGGHKPREISRSSKNTFKRFMVACEVWAVALSCWNHK